MQYCRIDPDGLFIEDVIADARPVTDTGEPDPAYIAVPVPQDAGFTLPRWDGTAWVEGGMPPAPPPPAPPTPEERMDQVEAALMELAALISEVM